MGRAATSSVVLSSSIELPHKPGEQVTVVMDLSKSTHEIIKQDSAATIETEGMLGNQYLAISFGSADSTLEIPLPSV